MGMLSGFKNYFFSGAIAAALIGGGFWYVMENFYPTYADNYMYLAVIGILFIVFTQASMHFAKKF